MNFIAHFYVLNQPQNPAFVFGNVWPDFQRGFTKLYNRELKHDPKFLASDIGKGVQMHLQTDAFFHSHVLFQEAVQTLEQNFNTFGVSHNKMPFTAHILFELLIDQYLLLKNPALSSNFYAVFSENALKNLLISTSKFLGKDENDEIIRKFRSFISGNYAQYLTQDKDIVEALNAIIGKRIGVHFATEKWTGCVEKSAEACQNIIPAILLATKNEMKKHD